MSGRHGSTPLRVVHLCYPSPDARLQIVTRELTAPADAGSAPSWFFVDVPLIAGGTEQQGLELAVWGGSEGTDAGLVLADRVRRWLRAGLITAAWQAGGSLVLQPGLYPGAVPPPWYADALAVGSVRACAFLSEVAATGQTRVPAATVRAELARTYRTLIPGRSPRRAALLWHAAWLESIARRDETEDWAPVGDDECDEPSLSAELRDYTPFRRRLAAHVGRLIVDGAASMREARDEIRAALVARLTHIQVVRLWGPLAGDSLLREAALLRGLAGSLR